VGSFLEDDLVGRVVAILTERCAQIHPINATDHKVQTGNDDPAQTLLRRGQEDPPDNHHSSDDVYLREGGD